jgi:hypothetical protein
MNVCSISWDGNSDETKIKFSDSFENAGWIVRADVLRDVIDMLTEEYNDVIAKQAKIINENMQKKAIQDSVKLSAS